MRLFSTVTWTVFSMALGSLAGVGIAAVSAQTSPPPMTCEQQLEQAQATAIQLRKEKAQAEFTGATIEEFARSCKKQLDAATATKPDKAAAQAPTTGSAPSQK